MMNNEKILTGRVRIKIPSKISIHKIRPVKVGIFKPPPPCVRFKQFHQKQQFLSGFSVFFSSRTSYMDDHVLG